MFTYMITDTRKMMNSDNTLWCVDSLGTEIGVGDLVKFADVIMNYEGDHTMCGIVIRKIEVSDLIEVMCGGRIVTHKSHQVSVIS